MDSVVRMDPAPITPAQLAQSLAAPDGAWPKRPWALLDVREAGEFAAGHIPGATSLPRRMLEFRISDLVPCRDTSIVIYDAGKSAVQGGEDRRAALAAATLRQNGWTRISILIGGISAYRAQGCALAEGVNVPCKTFGERILHDEGVPQIEPDMLAARLEAGERLVICDVRSPGEYAGAHLPGAYGTPSFDLSLHLFDLEQSYQGIVVNCAGRTRSIIGATTLKLLGARNLWALKNGTMGWELSGRQLERNAARAPVAPSEKSRAAVIARAEALALSVGVRTATPDDVAHLMADTAKSGAYLLDVRLLEEFTAGHISGAIFLAGGQAVQHADEFVAVGTSPVLIVDDGDARAWLTAYWYRRMGFSDVRVLNGGMPAWRESRRPWEIGRGRRPALGLAAAEVKLIDAHCLRRALDSGNPPVVIDVGTSRDFAAGHVPNAHWLPRGWLEDRIEYLAVAGNPCVIASRNQAQALLAAATLRAKGYTDIAVLEGGVDGWQAAGLDMAAGLPSGEIANDIVEPPYQQGLKSMQRYLDWEVRLLSPAGSDSDRVSP
ncbi:MAG: rhodanese-like domain-containing protein [Pseudolabrys sp.]|nr:rhodanese-like domain-containing protein [Pseudolabrys sp.]MDP2298930.1 rhodanese-like domain-containing protein [Pseudolabrys sp.]